jgi:hypothetical protein
MNFLSFCFVIARRMATQPLELSRQRSACERVFVAPAAHSRIDYRSTGSVRSVEAAP